MSNLRRRSIKAIVPGAAALLVGVSALAAHASPAAAATGAVIEVQAAGAGGGPAFAPGVIPAPSVYAAETLATALGAHENVTVELGTGTYRLSRPLTFTARDAGRNGHTITWEAAPGAHPVFSGARRVTDWRPYDTAKNIWVAHVGKGTNSRQLYVDGKEAPNAAIALPRSDVTFTATGLTITSSSLGNLASLPDQNQIQLESLDSFTDRYAPVQSISGTTITMQQPAWANNNWGYDVLAQPFQGGTMFLENSLSFIQQPGQWSLDSSTGKLYYEAPAGQTMRGRRRRTAPAAVTRRHQRQLQHPGRGPDVPRHRVHRDDLAGAKHQPGVRRPAERHVYHRQLATARIWHLLLRLPALRGHQGALEPDARGRAGSGGQGHHVQRRYLP
jgi:hypothetical protein